MSSRWAEIILFTLDIPDFLAECLGAAFFVGEYDRLSAVGTVDMLLAHAVWSHLRQN